MAPDRAAAIDKLVERWAQMAEHVDGLRRGRFHELAKEDLRREWGTDRRRGWVIDTGTPVTDPWRPR